MNEATTCRPAPPGPRSSIAIEDDAVRAYPYGKRGTTLRRFVAVLFVCLIVSGVRSEPPAASTDDGEAQKKLGKRLIRQTTITSDEDVMDRIILLMEQATRQLEVEFDAGERTQAVQQDILKQLDDAIKLAASQTRKSSGGQSRSQGDQRKRQDQKPPGQKEKAGAQQGGDDERRAGGTESLDQDGAGGVDDGKELAESRRGWGHLPERERDEVIQGADEKYLERYRQWIEQYYRALQDAGE